MKIISQWQYSEHKMNVIIFDKTADSDPTDVGVINAAPKWLAEGHTIDELVHLVPNGAAYEIVDDSVLPHDKPRELWTWE